MVIKNKMAKRCLMLGGFTKFGDTLCHSTFVANEVNDAKHHRFATQINNDTKLSLKIKGNDYIKVNNNDTKYYRAIMFYSKDRKYKDEINILVDGKKRSIKAGSLIINDKGKPVIYTVVKPEKSNKIPCYLYRFIRGRDDGKNKYPYGAFTIYYDIEACTKVATDQGQPISLDMDIVNPEYTFLSWYVLQTFKKIQIIPCPGGDNLSYLVNYIQTAQPGTYKGNYLIGYLCQDSAGVKHVAGQEFDQQYPPNSETSLIMPQGWGPHNPYQCGTLLTLNDYEPDYYPPVAFY